MLENDLTIADLIELDPALERTRASALATLANLTSDNQSAIV